MARDGEEEEAGDRRALLARALIDADVDLLPQISDFGRVGPDAPPIGGQRALIRQYLLGNPLIEIVHCARESPPPARVSGNAVMPRRRGEGGEITVKIGAKESAV